MFKKLFFISLTLALAGCATASSTLKSWVGKSDTALVQKWGIPHRQMEKGGESIYEYSFCDGGTSISQNVSGYQLATYNQNCERWTFFIKDGQIVRGNFDPI